MMHNTIKKASAALLAMLLLVSFILPANAVSTDANAQIAVSAVPSLLKDIGQITSGGTVSVYGIDNNLFVEFVDPEKAISDLHKKIPNLLHLLSLEYSLDKLTSTNWQAYQSAMYSYFDSDNKPSNYTESNVEFRTLRAFFDMYENTDKNKEILRLGEELSKTRDGDVTELALLLPYTEPLAAEFAEKNAMKASRAPLLVDEAIKYATEYATSPNKPTYYYFSNGDCANFVSQILEHAGVSQVVYDSEYSGWWHTRTSGFLGIGYTHKHSRSWTMADTFSRYMGIVYTTTSNRSFSENIEAGSIIAADFDSDGDWDHMGFVTDTSSYVGTYGYYDYRVAQHTSNYHGWASLETNGWDTIEDDDGTYARIRN